MSCCMCVYLEMKLILKGTSSFFKINGLKAAAPLHLNNTRNHGKWRDGSIDRSIDRRTLKCVKNIIIGNPTRIASERAARARGGSLFVKWNPTDRGLVAALRRGIPSLGIYRLQRAYFDMNIHLIELNLFYF